MNKSTHLVRRRYPLISLLALLAMVVGLLAVPAPASPQEKLEPASGQQQSTEMPAADPYRLGTWRATGGPDAFGYEWVDSAEPSGPVFTATDISITGALIATGDEVSGPAVLGAPFSFYGTAYTTLTAATNGYISTSATDTGGDFSNDCPLPAVPSTGSGARIYPLHDDLVSDVYYQYFSTSPVANPNGLAMGASVFQWNAEHWPGDGTKDFTFWAILFDNGDMVFQMGAGNTETGSGSTTGIQNVSATDGLTVACNTAASIPDNYAVWVTRTPPHCTLTPGISNGSFETGDFTNWCTQDLALPFDPLAVVATGTTGVWGFYPSAATDGAFLARHGFDGNEPGTIALRQQVTIPATAAVANLTFDWRAAWDFAFTGTATLDRSLDVTVEPAGGGAPLATTNIVTTDYAVTPLVGDTGQQSATVDMSGFAGSAIVVGLVATVPESSTGPANMDIDNVKLTINNKPAVTAPIADIVVPALTPNTVIELNTVFTELEGEAMTFSATSSNPAVVKATVGSPLTLAYPNAGTATVTVTATDSNGYSNSDSFTVTVTPVAHDVGLVDVTTGKWYLRDAKTGTITTFFYGNPVDLPISGDWNGDGVSTPGLYRQSDGFFYARDTNTQGPANNSCFAGDPSDIPVVGDWDGDGDDNLGIYRPSEQKFYLFTITCTGSPMGAAQIVLGFGNPGDKPVAGDWDGDGVDEVGLHRESTGFFYWRNTLDTGIASGQIFFGDPNDRFVAGDWGTVDGVDTPAIFRPSDLKFYFRHTLTQGVADSEFAFPGAGSGWLPVSGIMGLS